MEEDIKILEEYLLTLEKMGGMEMLKRGDVLISYVKYKNIQAIENLIKGYREKEESEKYLYDAYQDAGKKMFEYLEQLEDSIPKSKVKEKIEELENKIKATFCKYMTEEEYYNNKFLTGDVAGDYEVIEVSKLIRDRNLLQELLGDEE